MKLKTLLLGSAAAFAVVGGAQAADLSVAEPVEYVRACDAFGAGYFYLPGSDTCLQITGHVEFDANFHANSLLYGITTAGHSASWDFQTSGGVYFDAKSMTDVGVLEGSLGFKGTYDGKGNSGVVLDGAFVKLGALKAGHFGSTFNPGTDYNDVDFGVSNPTKSSLSDSNHLELAFKAGNIGLTLGIEDPRESFGTSLPANYSLPLIDGNMTFSGSNISGFLSAGYTQLSGLSPTGSASSWGVDGELTFNIDSSNAIRVNGAYGDNPFIGGGLPTGTPAALVGYNNGWSAFASLQHYFSKTLRTDWTVGYLDPSGPSAINRTNIAGDLVWLPYAGFRAKVGATWTSTSVTNSWAAQVALRRDW